MERLNIALSAASYYVIRCRFLELSGITLISTSNTFYRHPQTRRTQKLNLTTRKGIMMDESCYLRDTRSGWDMANQMNRRIRETICQAPYKDGVIPDWQSPNSTLWKPIITMDRVVVELASPRNMSDVSTHMILES